MQTTSLSNLYAFYSEILDMLLESTKLEETKRLNNLLNAIQQTIDNVESKLPINN